MEICIVHTDDNIADPLTKPLAQQKHDRHTESLGIRYAFGKEFPKFCSLVYSGGLSRDLDEIFVEIQDPSKWFHQEKKIVIFSGSFCLVRFLRDSKNEGVRSET
ncbi:hypothetical protein V6N13_059206 [Hibiscus sabdariffa]